MVQRFNGLDDRAGLGQPHHQPSTDRYFARRLDVLDTMTSAKAGVLVLVTVPPRDSGNVRRGGGSPVAD
jgi:hypothetical protein